MIPKYRRPQIELEMKAGQSIALMVIELHQRARLVLIHCKLSANFVMQHWESISNC